MVVDRPFRNPYSWSLRAIASVSDGKINASKILTVGDSKDICLTLDPRSEGLPGLTVG